MYDGDGKLLSGIKKMYVDSLAHVKVKGGESERLMIDRGVRQGCILFPWLFNVYMDAVTKEGKMVMGRREVRFEEGGESGDYLADDLELCVKLEKELRAIV